MLAQLEHWLSECVSRSQLIRRNQLTPQLGWMTVPHLAIVSCAMLASPDPSALREVVWDGGAIASWEKSERGSWDSIKSKAEVFALGR